MARDMTVENLPLGQKPKQEQHESLADRLNTPATRRNILRGVVAAAGGVIAYGVAQKTGLLNQNRTEGEKVGRPVQAEAVDAVKPSIFDSLRDLVRYTTATGSERTEALGYISDFEKISQPIESLASAYESRKDANGKPSLYNLIRDKYPVDLKPVWQGRFETERAYLENYAPQLFFMRDKKRLERQLQESDKIRTGPELIASLRKFHEGVLKYGLWSFYFKVNSQKNSNLQIEVPPNTSPSSLPSSLRRTEDDERRLIAEVAKEVPAVGDVKVLIRSGWTGKLETPGRLTPPVTSIGRDQPTEFNFKKHVAHELTHTLSRWEYLSANYTPEQLIDLAIAYEQLAADPNVGRTYLDKVFTTEAALARADTFLSKPLTLEVFRARSSLYPNSIWIGQTQEYYGALIKPIFAEQLDMTEVNQWVVEAANKASNYHSITDFIDKNEGRLNDLSNKSFYWKAGINYLRENVHQFNQIGWAAVEGLPFSENKEREWWDKTLPMLVRYGLLVKYIKKDPELLNSLSTKEKSEINAGVVLLVDKANEEHIAETVGYYMAIDKNRLSKEGRAPIERFLNAARVGIDQGVRFTGASQP